MTSCQDGTTVGPLSCLGTVSGQRPAKSVQSAQEYVWSISGGLVITRWSRPGPILCTEYVKGKETRLAGLGCTQANQVLACDQHLQLIDLWLTS